MNTRTHIPLMQIISEKSSKKLVKYNGSQRIDWEPGTRVEGKLHTIYTLLCFLNFELYKYAA